MRRMALICTVVAVAVLVAGSALAQDEGADGRRPRRPAGGGQPGGFDRQRPGGPGGQGGPRQPGLPFGVQFPAIREEMERHTAEMRAIQAKVRPDMEALREKIRELREQGKSREEIREALKPDPAKAQEVAGEIADALAIHYANLAKILKENRDAAAKSIAEGMAQRLARGGRPGEGPGGPRRQPGGDGAGPPRRRPGPDGPPEPAPANF
ncbi:MAG: hypothetical protein ISS72_04175 [Candidatus Brocadiae bacterium]|nr:hypothetical protein [Candidatus Brocadiia bacterium]